MAIQYDMLICKICVMILYMHLYKSVSIPSCVPVAVIYFKIKTLIIKLLIFCILIHNL